MTYDQGLIDKMTRAVVRALKQVKRDRIGASYALLDAVYGPVDPDWERYNRTLPEWQADRVASEEPRIIWCPYFSMSCLTSDDGRVACTVDGPTGFWGVSSNTIRAFRPGRGSIEVYRDHSGGLIVEGPWWDTIAEVANGAEARANAVLKALGCAA